MEPYAVSPVGPLMAMGASALAGLAPLPGRFAKKMVPSARSTIRRALSSRSLKLKTRSMTLLATVVAVTGGVSRALYKSTPPVSLSLRK